MRYKLAIFDFDGTLADSFPWVVSVIDQVAVRYHFEPVGQSGIEALRRLGARQILQNYRVPIWKILPIANHLRQLMAQNIHQIRLFDGVSDLLQGLADRGIALGLVTSNTQENVFQILGPQNAARFRYYECSVSIFGKPARLKKILHQSGMLPGEAIYIGDEIRDLEAARKVRIPCGAVNWGYTHPDALLAHTPDEMFATLDEITSSILAS